MLLTYDITPMSRACVCFYYLSIVGLNNVYLVLLEAVAEASMEYWSDPEI